MNEKIAVVTSGGANFYSIEVSLQRLGCSYQLTNNKEVIKNAPAIILPGVGSAGFAMGELRKHDLIDILQNYKKPLLGVCLGMQLLYEFSEESNVECLGLIPGKINKFVADNDLIVPHMGWNNLTKTREAELLTNINLTQDVYFVHSYYAPINEATLASCSYGNAFSAMVQHGNFYGMQFHPEKSGAIGEKLLANFIKSF